jgi:hypothetical protein
MLAEMLLYDMLHAYTRKYVKLEIAGSEYSVKPTVPQYSRGKTKGEGELRAGIIQPLEDVEDARLLDVEGLNDEQRKLIYKRFGTVPWKAIMRPPVARWPDLVLSWDAEAIYRPGIEIRRATR